MKYKLKTTISCRIRIFLWKFQINSSFFENFNRRKKIKFNKFSIEKLKVSTQLDESGGGEVNSIVTNKIK